MCVRESCIDTGFTKHNRILSLRKMQISYEYSWVMILCISYVESMYPVPFKQLDSAKLGSFGPWYIETGIERKIDYKDRDNMGVSINGSTPKWLVYKGQSH